MAIVVHEVVGEFEFVKGDNLFHPLGSLGGGVRVDVDTTGHMRVSLTGYNPTTAVERVPGETKI